MFISLWVWYYKYICLLVCESDITSIYIFFSANVMVNNTLKMILQTCRVFDASLSVNFLMPLKLPKKLPLNCALEIWRTLRKALHLKPANMLLKNAAIIALKKPKKWL